MNADFTQGNRENEEAGIGWPEKGTAQASGKHGVEEEANNGAERFNRRERRETQRRITAKYANYAEEPGIRTGLLRSHKQSSPK